MIEIFAAIIALLVPLAVSLVFVALPCREERRTADFTLKTEKIENCSVDIRALVRDMSHLHR